LITDHVRTLNDIGAMFPDGNFRCMDSSALDRMQDSGLLIWCASMATISEIGYTESGTLRGDLPYIFKTILNQSPNYTNLNIIHILI